LIDLTQAFRKLHAAQTRGLESDRTALRAANEEMQQRRRNVPAGAEEVRWRSCRRTYTREGEEFLDTLDTDVERLLIDEVGALSYAYSLVCHFRMLKLREAEASGSPLMVEPFDDECEAFSLRWSAL